MKIQVQPKKIFSAFPKRKFLTDRYDRVIVDTDSVFKSYNSVSQSVNLLDFDLSDEDFTGDAAPLLEQ